MIAFKIDHYLYFKLMEVELIGKLMKSHFFIDFMDRFE